MLSGGRRANNFLLRRRRSRRDDYIARIGNHDPLVDHNSMMRVAARRKKSAYRHDQQNANYFPFYVHNPFGLLPSCYVIQVLVSLLVPNLTQRMFNVQQVNPPNNLNPNPNPPADTQAFHTRNRAAIVCAPFSSETKS